MTADGLGRSIWISAGAHSVLIAGLLFRAVVAPVEPIQIRTAIRVDVVDLPMKNPEPPNLAPPTQEPPATPPKTLPPAPPVEAPIKPPPPAPEVGAKKPDVKRGQKQALARLKALDALSRIKREVDREKAFEAARPLPIKGNQISKGNSLTGLEKIEYDRYFDEIRSKVLSEWSLPQWLADAPLRASIMVLIDERGFVTRKMVNRSSGNEVFDAKALEAIDASSPFPEPPQRLRGLLSTNGIVFNFPE